MDACSSVPFKHFRPARSPTARLDRVAFARAAFPPHTRGCTGEVKDLQTDDTPPL